MAFIQPSHSRQPLPSDHEEDDDLNESDIENGSGEPPKEKSSVDTDSDEHINYDSDEYYDHSTNIIRSTSSETNASSNTTTTNRETYPWSAYLKPVKIDAFTSAVGPNIDNVNIDYQSEPLDFFKLFFPEDLIVRISEQTNLYAAQKCARNFTPVSVSDIKTFIYINMMFGVHKLPACKMYWSSDPLLQIPCVADIMSRNRFHEISRYFHIADSRDFVPVGHDGYDPLFKIRPVITSLKSACNSLFKPGVAIAFGEVVIPFSGQLSYSTHDIKEKPYHSGVKVWCCCDSSTSFLLNFEFSTGKYDTCMPNGLGYHVIWTLGQPFFRKKHHFYFNNFFSSVKLANDLLLHDTYCCSTIKQNQKYWPKDLTGKIEEFHCQMRQVGNLVACWWRDKCVGDKSVMSLLSTNSSPVLETTSRQTRDGPVETWIPHPVRVYKSNIGGVDRHNELRSYYPIGRKSRKWWICCLWFLLEAAVLNAHILYQNMQRPLSSKPLSHLQFHLEIARSLMKASSRKRRHKDGPSASALAVPGTSVQHCRVRLPGRKKMCFQCRQEDVRTESNNRPETVYGCALCNTHLCNQLCFAKFHSQF